ncbi:TlpA family protein disulfide reductase [Pedobacter sp. KBS0701]|uniref:peroxiredoxin family protein n=1 Tax=Pedobacter sp. KBS0701 TaxID=2578106 RepID=UPI00110E1CEC|nr:TlpA disulfide reductase family protein [Pedobacter sp. KBS0701]QDW25337.1 TlpA family protein disulfide reductase [Pedobacter sp. KBS0701]
MNLKSIFTAILAISTSLTFAQQQAVLANRQQATIKEKKAKAFVALGHWRGIAKVKEGLEIPFNFEINEKSGQQKLYFRNAEESFEGGRVKQTADSLFVKLDQFDNELAFAIVGDQLTGALRKQDKTGKPLIIIAERKNYRFKTDKPATADYSGSYDVVFTSTNGKEEKTVGLFKQTGNKLTGTFLRVTGDSRYLEGVVEGNEFQLSSFIGSSPSYYKGTFQPDGTLSGEILGARGSQAFTGTKNKDAALPDPYKLTYLKKGYKTLDFSFPDVNGKKISLKDEKYKNKVVILTITGSWCPNCVDEVTFMAPWYKKNKNRGVEIIGLHYERSTEPEYAKKVMTRFRDRFGIEYDQVLAGTADKQVVSESLPALDSFLSFPTTIIIDKQGNVAQIHTGFNGPATGKFYDEFLKEFNTEIDTLLKK